MASNYLAKGLKRSALTVALGMCFVGGVQAQTNTAGAVNGHAAAGDTITITNAATGYSRTITVGGDGNYRFSAVPSGQYQVSRNGGAPRNVNVNVGTASNVDFVSGDATTLDTVTVVGSGAINPIDVSSVESTTILTAEQIAKIPVPRNATAVALLAPGTVRGDAAFGNLASFGGSSVAENQYYVNGFNITNTFANLNFAQIPFEAIAEQQVKTGGYGAEFGRSTGGVLNVITKRGTNEFHAGGNIFWSPEALRETNPDFYTNAVGEDFPAQFRSPALLISDNSKDNQWAATASVWASGALIKDRLFAYALLQYGRTDGNTYPGSTDGVRAANNSNTKSKTPNWLLKMDWNITDNHMLELTAFSDKNKTEVDRYRTTLPAGNATSTNRGIDPGRGAYVGTLFTETGGDNAVLKYTGYLTDNFTLSALYGHSKFSRANRIRYANGTEMAYAGNLTGTVAGCPRIIDSRTIAQQTATGTYIGCELGIGLLTGPGAEDKRDQYRIDAEWQLGDHLIRGGIDVDKFQTYDGSADEGGVRYQYTNLGSTPIVVRTIFRNGANAKVDQRAFYLEDSWSVTDNFTAYLGLRWDTFENKNGLDQTYAKISNQFAPRLGFSWDVLGDSTFKVFGNAGRYALPLTSTVAIRGASASRYEIEYFTYTAVDPVTRAPTLGESLNEDVFGFDRPFYANNEFGLPKNPKGFASENLQPMYQDEYILGFQKQLTDHFSLGVRGIHRDLKRAIDDTCDYHAINEWGEEHGLTPSPIFLDGGPAEGYNTNYGFCHLYNPGQDGVFKVDIDGDGKIETVEIPADRLGPAAKRKYTAVEFFWQGNWDRFFVQGSYTLAKSIGNSEGGVKSDIGQADTGTTQDFDWPELMQGAYGYLPNDRRHSLKLFGNYEITDEWSVGANLLVQSGRPVNCIGIYGNDPVNYRVAYFSCDKAEPNAETTQTPGSRNNGYTIIPRGSYGRLPWSQTLDLNIAYAPTWAKGLEFKVDVFNVLNSRKVTSVNEAGETSTGSPGGAAANFLTPASWQAPRSVRFMVQYEF